MAQKEWKWVTELAMVWGAFVGTGLLIGWMVGASKSPVVATFIPLVFGLIGALSYGLIERSKKSESLMRKLQQLDLEEALRKKILSGLDFAPDTRWSRIYWASGVILFCAASYAGIQLGSGNWWGGYETTSELMAEVGAAPSALNPGEYAAVCSLRYRLEYLGAPREEIRTVFQDFVKPWVEDKSRQVEPFDCHSDRMLRAAEKTLQAIKSRDDQSFEKRRSTIQKK